MKTKLSWAAPLAAFAVAIGAAAASSPSWAALVARSAAMQAGGSTITVG